MSQSLFTRLANRYEDRHRRMTRREALAKLALAGAAAALPGCATTGPVRRRGPRRGTQPRVAVVGAGLGGLVAADSLAEAGYEVVVFEARQRVGGRVLTLRNLGPKYAEAGGEWIGLNHLAWRRLADRFALKLVEATQEEGLQPIVLDGRRLNQSEAEALYEELAVHMADLTQLSRQIVEPARPWTIAEAQKLDNTSVEEWFAGRTMSQTCRAGLRAQLENDNGAALSRMSLLGLLAQVAGGGGEAYWTDSEVFRCRGGNQRLAESLAQDLGTKRIQLGNAVERIELGEHRCTVFASAGAVEAETVMLATPPSTWHKLSVTGPRGREIQLPGVQMGAAFKYLATASSPWWRGAGMCPDGFSDQLLGYTWNAGDGQVVGGHELICGFGGGPQAERLPKVDGERRAMLRAAAESLLPGFAQARIESENAERLLVWPDDPWTRAGYSCPAPGQVTTRGPALAAGITIDGGHRPSLVFAGEHCCPAFVGYMEGALQSGLAAAEQIDGRHRAATVSEQSILALG